MDKRVIGLLTFLSSLFVIIVLVTFLPNITANKHIQVRVINNTFTNSLDGSQRYLSVLNDEGSTFRVNTSPKIHCPEGSIATLVEVESLTSAESSYKFLNCKTDMKSENQ